MINDDTMLKLSYLLNYYIIYFIIFNYVIYINC